MSAPIAALGYAAALGGATAGIVAAFPRRELAPWLAAPLVPAALALFQGSPGFTGVCLTTHAVLTVLRAIDLARLEHSPASRGATVRFFLDPFSLPPGVPRSVPPTRVIVRRGLRGLFLFGAGALFFAARVHAPATELPAYLEDVLATAVIAVTLTGFMDLVATTEWSLGQPIADPHDASFVLAPTLGIFWARWNRVVSGITFRGLYGPAGGHRRPLRAALVVFFATGLLHSIPFLAGFEDRRDAVRAAVAAQFFFLVHGVAVALDERLSGRPRRGGPRALARRAFVWAVWLATVPLYPGPAVASVGLRPFRAITLGRGAG